jgi:hypothetical protein
MPRNAEKRAEAKATGDEGEARRMRTSPCATTPAHRGIAAEKFVMDGYGKGIASLMVRAAAPRVPSTHFSMRKDRTHDCRR